jgi:hypothetical protein
VTQLGTGDREGTGDPERTIFFFIFLAGLTDTHAPMHNYVYFYNILGEPTRTQSAFLYSNMFT